MTILVLLLMGFFASMASFFLKKSTDEGIEIKKVVFNPYFYLGSGLYVISALINLYLLKRLPYSVVVSLGSLTYIWTLGIAHIFLKESITRNKIFGIVLLLMGVSLIATAI